MAKTVLDTIFQNKIIAIIRGIEPDRIVHTVDSLLTGGIKLVEVTYDQRDQEKIKDTLKSLELIKGRFGDAVCMGAGTVLTEEQVVKAIDAGAQYIISPNVDIKVINKTRELNKIAIPGAFTPSEMTDAYNAGAAIVKLFPAGVLGPGYIKALLAPLAHIPVIAVGGIDDNNIDQFMKAGARGVGVGGNLVDKKAVYSGEYNSITESAKSYIRRITD
jgi:2-dehydro-3-deoxyphosphogluconate aldolase/(4S)-4-hydroxy-2-oxoglutarate aldolase